MKAAVMRANKEPLSIEDVAIDDPGPGEVLVRTVTSGICHSDLQILEGNIPLPPPVILGHEPAGIVEGVGQLGDLSSFAERMLCTERSLVKIRDEMPLDRACLTGRGGTTVLVGVVPVTEMR